MTHELMTHPNTEQALIAEGRHQEAVRMARIALTRCYGSLHHAASLGLERLDVATLEALTLDATLTPERLRQRLSAWQEAAALRDESGKRVYRRLSPLGGYRLGSHLSAGEPPCAPAQEHVR